MAISCWFGDSPPGQKSELFDSFSISFPPQTRQVDAKVNLKTIYENEKFVCGIALIDNYDELMQNTSNSDKPKLVASIEELLDEYAQNSCGILRKYEKDRFYFYFQKQYLDNLYNDKFQILDRIKDIKVGNSISPTLSIGIGFGGSVMSENETFSLAALDMALGRGGDQVIIKNKDDYHFFGGKS